MIRIWHIFSFLLIVVAAFGLFKLKFAVQELKKDIAEMERQVDSEKEAVHVLEAEWTYLNQPERLRKLATKYLPNMEVMKLAQMRKLSETNYALQFEKPINVDVPLNIMPKEETGIRQHVKWNYRKTKDNIINVKH